MRDAHGKPYTPMQSQLQMDLPNRSSPGALDLMQAGPDVSAVRSLGSTAEHAPSPSNESKTASPDATNSQSADEWPHQASAVFKRQDIPAFSSLSASCRSCSQLGGLQDPRDKRYLADSKDSTQAPALCGLQDSPPSPHPKPTAHPQSDPVKRSSLSPNTKLRSPFGTPDISIRAVTSLSGSI